MRGLDPFHALCAGTLWLAMVANARAGEPPAAAAGESSNFDLQIPSTGNVEELEATAARARAEAQKARERAEAARLKAEAAALAASAESVTTNAPRADGKHAAPQPANTIVRRRKPSVSPQSAAPASSPDA